MSWHDNQELEDKYKSSVTFKKQMDKISDKFREFEQQAYYSDLEQSAKHMILSVPAASDTAKKLNNLRDCDLFIILGARQSPNSVEKILLNLIYAIPRPKKKYCIIYINTLAPKNAFDDFMKMTAMLPIEYFVNLEALYVLQASFISKALGWVSFNAISGFLKVKTIHAKDFRELAELAQLKEIELLRLLPSEIRGELAKEEEHVQFLLANNAMKLVTMQDMSIKQSKSEDKTIEVKREPQKFNPPKRSSTFPNSIKPIKHEIEDYVPEYVIQTIGQTGAPLPLELLIFYFTQREKTLEQEGIFRKSVSIDEETEMLAQLQQQNYDYIESIKNPHIIANVIKRFLAYLATPLIPFQVFDELMEANEGNIRSLTIEKVKALSEVRRKTILILVQFFLDKVIPKEEKNKMGLKNICIVLGPCIMWAKVSSIKDLVYSQKIIAVISIIFKELISIFGSKKERELSLRKSAKEFNRAYLEERLGMFESKVNCNELKPCELTTSQMEVIRQSRKEVSVIQDQQYTHQKKVQQNEKEILHRVSKVIHQQLEEDLMPSEDLNIESEEPINRIEANLQSKFLPPSQEIEIMGLEEATQETLEKANQEI